MTDSDRIEEVADRLMAGGEPLGRTDALVVSRHGEVVLERYGEGVDASTELRSWSMAKSVLHAAVGILVGQGALDPEAGAPVPEWRPPGDPRGAITLRHLLEMRPGLGWAEDYVDGHDSDVIEMLFAREWTPVADTGAFAAAKPLVAEPGTVFNYSSGTSNIISRIVRDVVGPGEEYRRWLVEHLFEPVGMSSATPVFDDVGTWIASSYCSCTARDFERFGRLYLEGGFAGGEQVVPPEWILTASRAVSQDEEGRRYAWHWWVLADSPWDVFHCAGYQGQYIMVVPALDVVLVRCGDSDAELRPTVVAELVEILGCFDGSP
jgi:CubicO group peptidase (beta-lactamase class C family)